MSVAILASTIFIMAVAASQASATCCDATSYPVALDDLGPRPCPLPVIGTMHTTQVIEKPVIRLPAAIPPPRTISNRCRCLKTIVKPQVVQQVINVPTIQRYIETSSRPVVERIHYNAHPINAPSRESYATCCYNNREVPTCGCRDAYHVPVVAQACSPYSALPVRAVVPVSLPYRRVATASERSCYQRCACAC